MLTVTVSTAASLDEAKRIFVLTVLARHEGDKRLAAQQLGVSLKAIYNWLHKWGVPVRGRP